MADGQTPAPESWRIVVFTNMPGGMIYSLVDEVVRPLGHRVVGVVTSPGPKRRRSPTYLEVVAAVPPGVDVIVSNHPERWAAMLAPLRARSDHQRWLPLAHPGRRPGAASARRDQFPRRPPAAAPRTERDRLGLPHRTTPRRALTIHRLTPEFDTGPILAQARVPITDDDDYRR